jgi:hypothetical protein
MYFLLFGWPIDFGPLLDVVISLTIPEKYKDKSFIE